MRKAILLIIILLGLAILIFPIAKPFAHRTMLKSYFANADGLRSGAPVRLAGVEVGSVRTVRARPELRDGFAEVVMALVTDYDLRIPTDATASIFRAGVLGETYVDIDANGASGPPTHNGDVLKTRPPGPDAQQMLEHLIEALRKLPCAADALHSIEVDTTTKVAPKK